MVGLARALVIDPELPSKWLDSDPTDPVFPRLTTSAPGDITAWYTMRLTDLARRTESEFDRSLDDAVSEYLARDDARVAPWIEAYGQPST